MPPLHEASVRLVDTNQDTLGTPTGAPVVRVGIPRQRTMYSFGFPGFAASQLMIGVLISEFKLENAICSVVAQVTARTSTPEKPGRFAR